MFAGSATATLPRNCAPTARFAGRKFVSIAGRMPAGAGMRLGCAGSSAWVSTMAWLLEIAIIDGGDGEIKVVHQFYGVSKKEAETYKKEHLGNCGYFASAQREHRTLETWDEIPEDDLPTAEDYEEQEQEEEG